MPLFGWAYVQIIFWFIIAHREGKNSRTLTQKVIEIIGGRIRRR